MLRSCGGVRSASANGFEAGGPASAVGAEAVLGAGAADVLGRGAGSADDGASFGVSGAAPGPVQAPSARANNAETKPRESVERKSADDTSLREQRGPQDFAAVSNDLYLMSPPGRFWSLRGRANFKSQKAESVDARLARREWLALAEAIEACGGTVAVLPPVETLTGLPFAAEAGHVLAPRPGGSGQYRFVLPRMATEHRKAEREHWGPFAERLGFEVVELGGGHWEGQGDVATFDGATLLFWGQRSDRAGLASALEHFEGEVMALELRAPAFHGNMAVLPLPAVDRLLLASDLLEGDGVQRLLRRFGGGRVEHVDEDEVLCYATNGLPIGERWLCPSVVPARVKELVREWGMRVEELAMAELCEKGGGAARCLVCHAPGAATRVDIPEENRLAVTAAEIRAE